MAALLTLQQAADLLAFNADHLRVLCRQKKVPGIKILHRWRFSRRELERWIEEQRNP